LYNRKSRTIARRISLIAPLSCAIVLGATLLLPRSSARQAAQTANAASPMDQQIQMLRRDLRSQRKQIIAQNMNLNDQDAVKFWPIYDQYVSELVESNNAKYELIKEYAQADTMTDDQVDTLAKRWLSIDENVVKLRVKYLPTFRKALSAKQTARFFQLDRQVQMMIDMQLASSLPLVG
jgi:Spy/CpxP family protein refolding chaperone